MNLYRLKTFYFAAKFGSLSKAADQLYITQPAVTKQIQQLQKHYELKFLNRFGKKMVLTDAGQALYSIAEKIFEMESQAEEIIRDFQQLKSGYIRILSSESFGAYYLPNIITRFDRLHPEICLSANILTNEEVVENTARLNNDLGFTSYPVEHKKLVVKEVLEDALILIVPPGHPFSKLERINPGDLEDQPLIMHEKGSATSKIVGDFIRKNNLSIPIKCELSNNESIKRLVEQGVGLAIISKNVVNEEIRYGSLVAVPLTEETLKRKFYMIHHKDKYFSKTLQDLINIALNWSPAYPDILSGSLTK